MYGVSDMVVVVIFLVVEVILVSIVGVVSSKYGVRVEVNNVLAIGIVVVDIIVGNMVFGGTFVVVVVVIDVCVDVSPIVFPIVVVSPFVIVIDVDAD